MRVTVLFMRLFFFLGKGRWKEKYNSTTFGSLCMKLLKTCKISTNLNLYTYNYAYIYICLFICLFIYFLICAQTHTFLLMMLAMSLLILIKETHASSGWGTMAWLVVRRSQGGCSQRFPILRTLNSLNLHNAFKRYTVCQYKMTWIS